MEEDTRHIARMSLKAYIKAIAVFGVISMIPIPAFWDIVADAHGATIEDKKWYICFYIITALSFALIDKLTRRQFLENMFFKVCKLLLIGKVIDQFFDPYGYHVGELIWDTSILIWATIQYVKWGKTTAK